MGDDRDPDVSAREVLVTFANSDRRYLRPVDAAETLSASADVLRDRFEELAVRGLLDTDEEHEPGVAWRLADDAPDEIEILDDEVVTDVEAQAERVVGSETLPHDQETVEEQPPGPQETVPGRPYEAADDAIESFDPPGTPDQAAQRRRALRRAYEFLRGRGSGSREEIVDEVFPEEPGAYEGPDDGWWTRVVRPGLEQLPDVESVDDGKEWRYTGRGSSDRP